MVLQNVGRKLRFGVGSNYSGWHQNVFRILPLIIGVVALATSLLLGSYLWGLVTRRKKKQGETHAPSSESHPRAGYNIRPNTILSPREFRQGTGRRNEKERGGPAPLADFLSRADYNTRPNTILPLWEFTQGTGRKGEKGRHGPAPLADFLSRADYKPNTTLSFRDSPPYTNYKAPASFSPKVADYDDEAYFDDFDAQDDYSQDLADAPPHDANQIKPIYNSPERYQSVQSWLARSPDIRHHSTIFFEDAEEVFARHQNEILETHQRKAFKSWKKLMFWKRSKQNNQFEFNPTGDGVVQSSCATPIHFLFKSSKTRATAAQSTTSTPTNRNSVNKNSMNFMPKRSISGPIYYDGTPCTPNRAIRPFSGPLSASATPTRDGLYEPTYVPLKRPYGNYSTCPSPLYIP